MKVFKYRKNRNITRSTSTHCVNCLVGTTIIDVKVKILIYMLLILAFLPAMPAISANNPCANACDELGTDWRPSEHPTPQASPTGEMDTNIYHDKRGGSGFGAVFTEHKVVVATWSFVNSHDLDSYGSGTSSQGSKDFTISWGTVGSSQLSCSFYGVTYTLGISSQTGGSTTATVTGNSLQCDNLKLNLFQENQEATTTMSGTYYYFSTTANMPMSRAIGDTKQKDKKTSNTAQSLSYKCTTVDTAAGS